MLISLWASGYSRGQLRSFQCSLGGGFFHGAGMNLFHAFGDTPPGVPTEPVRTLSSIRQRVICQPCRLPAAAARQMWEEKAGAAAAMSRTSWTIVSAGAPLSASANAGV